MRSRRRRRDGEWRGEAFATRLRILIRQRVDEQRVARLHAAVQADEAHRHAGPCRRRRSPCRDRSSRRTSCRPGRHTCRPATLARSITKRRNAGLCRLNCTAAMPLAIAQCRRTVSCAARRSRRRQRRAPASSDAGHAPILRPTAARPSTLSSKLSILSFFSLVRPMSSRPLSMQCLRCGSMSNFTTPPSGPRISCFSRSIDSVALAPRSASSNSFSRSSGLTLIGSTPFLKQLL